MSSRIVGADIAERISLCTRYMSPLWPTSLKQSSYVETRLSTTGIGCVDRQENDPSDDPERSKDFEAVLGRPQFGGHLGRRVGELTLTLGTAGPA